jgi:hypothetical protein
MILPAQLRIELITAVHDLLKLRKGPAGNEALIVRFMNIAQRLGNETIGFPAPGRAPEQNLELPP